MPGSSRSRAVPDAIADTLRALALQRTPGFNFPGHFLKLAFERVSTGRARLTLDTTPLCADPDGQMNLGPFALLADIALAASFRGAVGASARVATTSLAIHLTGAPRVGRLAAVATLQGFVEGGAERQGLARGEIRSGRTLVATAEGTFMVLGKPNATAPHPLPKRGAHARVTIAERELDEKEREVLAHARAALASGAPFIRRFWGYEPEKADAGATCRAWNGPHVGNRVGHAQGGFSFGLAAETARAALPPSWALVGATSWYIGPGLGRWLTARSQVIHRGTLTAVVKTRIEDDEGRGVLETMTSHTRLLHRGQTT